MTTPADSQTSMPRARGLFALQPWLWRAFLAIVCLFPAAAQASETSDTIDQIAPKVAKIFGAGGRKNLHAYGSGFLVSPTGHIVTVWSHILDGDAVTVVLHDGRRYTGTILGAEPALDLAILKIEGEDLPYFDLAAESGQAQPGASVLAFSNVFKVATGDEPVSIIHGVIAARTRLSASRGAFDAPYSGPVYVVDSVTNNSGAAGGVLTTSDGKLLGMLGKELKNNLTHTWLNYVVPIEELQPAIEEIVTGKFKPRPAADEDAPVTLVRYSPKDFGLVMVPDVVARTPAYVDRVLPGSVAQTVGLKTDDLVVLINNRVVTSCRILLEELGHLEPGDTFSLVVRRGDNLETVQLVAPRNSGP